MNYTLADIRKKTYDRMFLEESEYEEYDSSFFSTINDAMLELSNKFPILREYKIIKPYEEGDGYTSYDLINLTSTTERVFKKLAVDPVYKVNSDTIYPYNDYITTLDRYLFLPKSEEGEFLIHYEAYPTKIYETTQPTFEIEFEPEAAALLPTLCAWRLFLDDDVTRATMYYNEYGQAVEELLRDSHMSTGIVIEGGIGW